MSGVVAPTPTAVAARNPNIVGCLLSGDELGRKWDRNGSVPGQDLDDLPLLADPVAIDGDDLVAGTDAVADE
jgi:hypothetical protein